MDKIDVLLATYNGEKYLRQQLDSILSQTYKNFNLIISDDCSNDGTLNILKEYEQKDIRIKVYYQSNNLGYVSNFEFLLNKVSSEYYMLCDQDDVWYKDKIEVSYNKIKEDKSDLVFTDLEIVDENLNTISSSFNKTKNLIYKINKYNDYRLEYLYNTVTGCTIISKREYLKMILPLPKGSKQIIHDYWIAVIISMNGKVTYLDKATLKYRQHSNNQVGVSKYTNRFKNFDDKRNHLIKVKLDIYNTFNRNNTHFDDNLKLLNKEAIKYFDMIITKKNFNFSNLSTFHKLYKNEKISYYILYFVIMNIPVIPRIGYAAASLFKK